VLNTKVLGFRDFLKVLAGSIKALTIGTLATSSRDIKMEKGRGILYLVIFIKGLGRMIKSMGLEQ